MLERRAVIVEVFSALLFAFFFPLVPGKLCFRFSSSSKTRKIKSPRFLVFFFLFSFSLCSPLSRYLCNKVIPLRVFQKLRGREKREREKERERGRKKNIIFLF